MPQLLIGLLIVFLIFGALQFLLPVLGYSLIAVVSGGLLALVVLLTLVNSELSRAIAEKNSGLRLKLNRVDKEFSFDFDSGEYWPALYARSRWIFIFLTIAGAVATIIVFANAGLMSDLRAFDSRVQTSTAAVWVVLLSVSGSLVLAVLIGDKSQQTIERLSRWKLQEVNRLLGDATGIFDQVTHYRHLTEALQIDNKAMEYELVSRIHTMPTRGFSLVSLEKSIRNLQSQMVQTNEQLLNAKGKLEEFEERYARAFKEANRSSSLSVFDYLSEIKKTGLVLMAYLEESDWDQFHEGFATLFEELDNLIAKPWEYEEQEQSEVAGSPYQVLGVREDITIKELKGVYRRLASLYHPDKGIQGLVQDGKKFVEIKSAYLAILDKLQVSHER